MRRRDTLQFVFLVTLLLLLPLPFGANRAWAWLAAASICFLLCGWTIATLRLAQHSRAGAVLSMARPALWAWLIWLAYGLLQIVPLPLQWLRLLSPNHPLTTVAGLAWASLSVDRYASLLSLLQSAFLGTLFVLILVLVRNRSRVRILALAMVGAGFGQAVYGSFMTLSGIEWGFFLPKEHGLGLATGTFVNRNHFAGFLEICLALGIGLLLAQPTTSVGDNLRAKLRVWTAIALGPKMRLRIALAVMVVALVLSHSRMGNSAFFIGLLVTGLLAVAIMRPIPRPLMVLLLSLIVIDVLIVGTWFGVEQVVERIQATGSYDPLTNRYRDQERLDVDRETLVAWRDYAWFGSGGGTFHTVFPAYRSDDLQAYFDHAHNDYLEFLLEYGVVGCLPLLVLVLTSLLHALLAQRRRREPLMRAIGFSVVMVGVSYAIHSSVDFNLHIPANAAYFTVALALAWVASALPMRRSRR